MKFEWNARKAGANLAKHGVSFEVATRVFADPMAVTIPDQAHSQDEEREITIGRVGPDMIVVIHTYRAPRLRIISARYATAKEIMNHES